MGLEIAIATLVITGAQAADSHKRAKTAERRGKRAADVRHSELLKGASAERERGRRLRASQRAAFGAAGLAADSGSPLELQFRSIMDSIDKQGRIIRGADAELADTRRQLEANSSQVLAAGISSTVSAGFGVLGKIPTGGGGAAGSSPLDFDTAGSSFA